jgi:hypothetical protein
MSSIHSAELLPSAGSTLNFELPDSLIDLGLRSSWDSILPPAPPAEPSSYDFWNDFRAAASANDPEFFMNEWARLFPSVQPVVPTATAETSTIRASAKGKDRLIDPAPKRRKVTQKEFISVDHDTSYSKTSTGSEASALAQDMECCDCEFERPEQVDADGAPTAEDDAAMLYDDDILYPDPTDFDFAELFPAAADVDLPGIPDDADWLLPIEQQQPQEEPPSSLPVPISDAPPPMPDPFCSTAVVPPSPAANPMSPEPPVCDTPPIASHFASYASLPPATSSTSLSSLGSFAIVSQPGPKSFLKNSKTERPEFDVQLRLAPGVSAAGPVRVYTTASSVHLLNDSASLDEEGRAHFSLMFDKGGLSFQIHRVYFKINITPPGGPAGSESISTDFSQPFIIRTNISQFVKADRILILQVAFQDRHEVSLSSFSASLAEHFRLATGGKRPLTEKDSASICNWFGGERTVTRERFEDFWEWFGNLLKAFTDTKFRKLWDKGVIFGFGSLESLSAPLLASPPPPIGTFLLGFTPDSPLLLMLFLSATGQLQSLYLSPQQLKVPFREYLTASPHLSHLLGPSTATASSPPLSVSLRTKASVIESLLPKKMLRSLNKKQKQKC